MLKYLLYCVILSLDFSFIVLSEECIVKNTYIPIFRLSIQSFLNNSLPSKTQSIRRLLKS